MGAAGVNLVVVNKNVLGKVNKPFLRYSTIGFT
jgi:hypothetical protein